MTESSPLVTVDCRLLVSVQALLSISIGGLWCCLDAPAPIVIPRRVYKGNVNR